MVLCAYENGGAKTGKSAEKQAREYGIDVSLLVANLRKTPAERLRQHSHALLTALALRQGMQKRQRRTK